MFRADSEYVWLFCHGSEEMAGSFGLHRRVGPGVIVVGYWVHVNYLRRGCATSGAQALTAAAFQLSDVGRVEIHAADENKASAATPRRLGCRWTEWRSASRSPAESGRLQIRVRHERAAGLAPRGADERARAPRACKRSTVSLGR